MSGVSNQPSPVIAAIQANLTKIDAKLKKHAKFSELKLNDIISGPKTAETEKSNILSRVAQKIAGEIYQRCFKARDETIMAKLNGKISTKSTGIENLDHLANQINADLKQLSEMPQGDLATKAKAAKIILDIDTYNQKIADFGSAKKPEAVNLPVGELTIHELANGIMGTRPYEKLPTLKSMQKQVTSFEGIKTELEIRIKAPLSESQITKAMDQLLKDLIGLGEEQPDTQKLDAFKQRQNEIREQYQKTDVKSEVFKEQFTRITHFINLIKGEEEGDVKQELQELKEFQSFRQVYDLCNRLINLPKKELGLDQARTIPMDRKNQTELREQFQTLLKEPDTRKMIQLRLRDLNEDQLKMLKSQIEFSDKKDTQLLSNHLEISLQMYHIDNVLRLESNPSQTERIGKYLPLIALLKAPGVLASIEIEQFQTRELSNLDKALGLLEKDDKTLDLQALRKNVKSKIKR